jgi:hypothetical protein
MIEKLPIGHSGSRDSLKNFSQTDIFCTLKILALEGRARKSPNRPDIKCPGYVAALAEASLKGAVLYFEARFTGRGV